MDIVSNIYSGKTGVKVAIVLLITICMLFTIYSVTMGAPGITHGDVNDDGDIDVRDVVLIMRYVLDLEDLTDDQIKAADVNADGTIDVRDASSIMRYALGLIDEFPALLSIKSVEEVEVSVKYGTYYENIDFPSTVTATLHDDSEEDVDVEWAEESDPEYRRTLPGTYEFEGELVDLPTGVSNPDDIKALAKVKVPRVHIPPPAPDPDPATPDLSNLDIAGQGDDATTYVYADEDISVDVENVGDESGSFTIELEVISDTPEINTNDVIESRTENTSQLDAGDSETITFTNVTEDLDIGNYDVFVADEDDNSSVEGSLTVTDEPFMTVEPDEVEEDENFSQTFTLELTEAEFQENIDSGNISVGEDFVDLGVVNVEKTTDKTATVQLTGILEYNEGEGIIEVEEDGLTIDKPLEASVTVLEKHELTLTASPEKVLDAGVELEGYGDYVSDEDVDISATDQVYGYEFEEWTAPAGSFDPADSHDTVFTMPDQDVTATANYVYGQIDNAYAADHVYGVTEETTWEFDITEVKLDEGQKITVDLSEAVAEGLIYHTDGNEYEVEINGDTEAFSVHADEANEGDDSFVTLEAQEVIDVEDTVTVTVPIYSPSSEIKDDLTVTFIREDTGAQDSDEFSIVNPVEALTIEQQEPAGIVKTTTSYIEDIGDVDYEWKVDALIKSEPNISSAASVYVYQGEDFDVPIGEGFKLSEINNNNGDVDEVWLSELIEAADEDADTRTPLANHAGQTVHFGIEVYLPDEADNAEYDVTVSVRTSADNFENDDGIELKAEIADVIFAPRNVINAVESLELTEGNSQVNATTNYRDNIGDVNDDWKVDALITSDKKIDAASSVYVYHDENFDTQIGDGFKFEDVNDFGTNDTTKVWLSELMGAADDIDTRTPLKGHTGDEATTNYGVGVLLPENDNEDFDITVTIVTSTLGQEDDWEELWYLILKEEDKSDVTFETR